MSNVRLTMNRREVLKITGATIGSFLLPDLVFGEEIQKIEPKILLPYSEFKFAKIPDNDTSKFIFEFNNESDIAMYNIDKNRKYKYSDIIVLFNDKKIGGCVTANWKNQTVVVYNHNKRIKLEDRPFKGLKGKVQILSKYNHPNLDKMDFEYINEPPLLKG